MYIHDSIQPKGVISLDINALHKLISNRGHDEGISDHIDGRSYASQLYFIVYF